MAMNSCPWGGQIRLSLNTEKIKSCCGLDEDEYYWLYRYGYKHFLVPINKTLDEYGKSQEVGDQLYKKEVRLNSKPVSEPAVLSRLEAREGSQLFQLISSIKSYSALAFSDLTRTLLISFSEANCAKGNSANCAGGKKGREMIMKKGVASGLARS